jgi:hypothetical protein
MALAALVVFVDGPGSSAGTLFADGREWKDGAGTVMQIAGFNEVILSRDQQRLLGGWRDIIDDIRHLCGSLERLPDACPCGQGAAHLGGSCPCCHAVHGTRDPACEDCGQLLATLRPALDGLLVDTMRSFPVVRQLLQTHAPARVQADGAGIEQRIADLYQTFARLVLAAEEFRAACRASHLKAIKTRAADLFTRAKRLEERLEGPVP